MLPWINIHALGSSLTIVSTSTWLIALSLFNLYNRFAQGVRTRLRSRLSRNEFLLAKSTNLDNSQIATHKGVFVFMDTQG
jgi:hypothetical protein